MAGRNFMPAGYSAHSLESWTLRTPGRCGCFPKLGNRIPGQVGVRKRLDPNYGHAHPGMRPGRHPPGRSLPAQLTNPFAARRSHGTWLGYWWQQTHTPVWCNWVYGVRREPRELISADDLEGGAGDGG
jgi:hypothetical protein